MISLVFFEAKASITLEDPKKSASVEPRGEHSVFFGMTQTEIDSKYAAILDVLLTGNTTEIVVDGMTEIG